MGAMQKNSNQGKVYIRFKPLPPSGHSRVFGIGKEEAGVSCYYAVPVEVNNGRRAWKPVGEAWNAKAKNRKPGSWLKYLRDKLGTVRGVCHLVTGNELPTLGRDREPLLANCREICELDIVNDDDSCLIEKW